MNDFIILHAELSSRLWIRASSISVIQLNKTGRTQVFSHPDPEGWLVKETPEEILKMINKVSEVNHEI